MGEVKLWKDDFLKAQIMTLIKYEIKYKTCQGFYLAYFYFIHYLRNS